MSNENNSFEENEKPKDLSNVSDNKKLKEIEKLQNLIFSGEGENIESTETEDKSTKSKKLIEHANFLHNFSDYGIRANDVVPLYFIKNHPNEEDGNFQLSSSVFPIITNINQKDDDTIEITRRIFYNDFNNKPPYNTERITIRRNTSGNKKPIFLSFYEDKMKKEIRDLRENGTYTIIAKFKYFRNPTEMLFLQNIYYYICSLETHFYQKKLTKETSFKVDFSIHNMPYNKFLKNLF